MAEIKWITDPTSPWGVALHGIGSTVLTKVVFKKEVKITQVSMLVRRQGDANADVLMSPRIFTESGAKMMPDPPGIHVQGFSDVWYNANLSAVTLQPGIVYYIGAFFTSPAPGGGSITVADLYNDRKPVETTIGTVTTGGVINQKDGLPNFSHTAFALGLTYTANTAPTMPGAFTSPVGMLNGGASATVTWGASTDADGNPITYYPEYRYYKNGVAQAWVALANNASLTRALTLSTDKTMDKIEFQVRAFDGSVYSGYRNSAVYTIKHNSAPNVALNTANNLTLYENDTFTINGTATDPDVGNVVNVKYQINSEAIRAIAVNISTGAAMPYNKQLTFKGGQLFDGATVVTSALNAGVAHSLKVWAEDDQGGKSAEQIRTFYVVPNRPPALTVDPFGEQAGMINNDTITLSGASSDPDGNDVVVAYKLNSNAAVQIHSGPVGPWTFDLQLKNLKDGENIIVVEVTDTYGFKSSKTIKLNKTANLTSLSQSTQRYEIMPPSGSAQGVLLWIQRDKDQEMTAEISMTTGSEQEQFIPMELKNSAPIDSATIEDDFRYQADAAKENIVLKLTWSGDKPITLISGVLV